MAFTFASDVGPPLNALPYFLSFCFSLCVRFLNSVLFFFVLKPKLKLDQLRDQLNFHISGTIECVPTASGIVKVKFVELTIH